MTNISSSVSKLLIYGQIIFSFIALILSNALEASERDRDIVLTSDQKPKFPISLWQQGIVTGHVKLIVTVDEYGILQDWLAVEATHRDLIATIEDVIHEWNFQPALVDGEPILAMRQIVVFFDVSHLKESIRKSSSASIAARQYSEYSRKKRGRQNIRKEALNLATADEIDRYPEMVEQRQPIISTKSLQNSLGSNVTFKFYIDTYGRVRMPTLYKIEGNPDPEAILAANAALNDWRFKPIKSNGKPVIFEVVQTFEFSNLLAHLE